MAAVRAVLETRVDVNAPDGDGATALHWAVHAEQIEMTRMLMAAGATVDVANELGITPLYLAGAAGNAAIVKRLLERGASGSDGRAVGSHPADGGGPQRQPRGRARCCWLPAPTSTAASARASRRR